MNERIKELESQCWVKVPCDFDMREGGLSTIRTVFDRQKFAELIVKECAQLVEDNLDPHNAWVTPGYIKEHFGIER
jgi:methyl coenzyme M reductase subunit D